MSILWDGVPTIRDVAFYEAGVVAGIAMGRAEVEADLVAEWAAIRPLASLAADGLRLFDNRRAEAERWAERFGGLAWDAQAERARCAASWGIGAVGVAA
jgi:hypothetical protein